LSARATFTDQRCVIVYELNATTSGRVAAMASPIEPTSAPVKLPESNVRPGCGSASTVHL